MNAPSSTGTLRKALLLAAVLALGACKKSGDALLVLQVTSSEDLAKISRFEVTVSTPSPVDAGKAAHLTYALDGGTVALPVNLLVTFSEDLGGIDVTIQAFGIDPSKPLASRTVSVNTPRAGETIELPIELTSESHVDGGTSDAAPDGGARDGAADGGDARDAIGDGPSDVPKLPRYTDNQNGTITDTATGLMWQQVVEASAGPAEGIFTYELAKGYCPQLVLGGHHDWRLPSIIELGSIVDEGKYNPSLDPAFGAAPPSSYWSSTPLVDAPSLAWYVSFLSGVQNTAQGSMPLNARCVREDGSAPIPAYTKVDDVVLAHATKLTWQRAAASKRSWGDAQKHCMTLPPSGGCKAWRLPTRNELLSLVDYTRSNPALDQLFPAPTETTDFWSSTSFAGLGSPGSIAWYVNFYFGISGFKNVTEPFAVRCMCSAND